MARPKIHLETIQIDGFRSCDRTSFSPRQDLSVLIGPNGSGKTNLLQGISLLSSGLMGAGVDRAGIVQRPASFAEVTATFRSGAARLRSRSTVRPPAGVRFTLNEDNPEEIVGERYSGPDKTVEKVVAFRRRIRYYSAFQFSDPAQCPSTIEIDQDGAVVGSARTGRAYLQFLLDLYQLKEQNPPEYASYVDLVGKQGLQLLSSIHWKKVKVAASRAGVRTVGKMVKQRRERVLLIPSVTSYSDRQSFNQLSAGTFKSLALVFYLIADTSDLLLLGEPEVGIHHGLLVSLLELIKGQSRNRQIIVSTHSDFVLDHVEPENVFCVTCSARGKTSVRSLADGHSPKQLTALRDYLRTQGSLGDYWREFGLES